MNTKLRKTTCYTQGVESRLRKSLEQFTALNRHRRAVFVTLTTKHSDPTLAKTEVNRLTDRLRRRFGFKAVFCLEFNEQGQAHYHVLLVPSGIWMTWTTASVRSEIWRHWKELGEHGKTAFNVKPADIRRPQTLINYMCKSDLPDGEPHEERWQKKLPAFLQSDGLPVRWWGELNAKTPQGRRKPRSRTRLRVPLERLPLAT